MKTACLGLLLGVFLIFFSGCVPQVIMNSMDRDHYSEYLQEADKTNLEREKAGLPRQSPMTFNEWSGKKSN